MLYERRFSGIRNCLWDCEQTLPYYVKTQAGHYFSNAREFLLLLLPRLSEV